jgi:hypothetical protein
VSWAIVVDGRDVRRASSLSPDSGAGTSPIRALGPLVYPAVVPPPFRPVSGRAALSGHAEAAHRNNGLDDSLPLDTTVQARLNGG